MWKAWAAHLESQKELKETSAAAVNSVPEPKSVQCLGTAVNQADTPVQTSGCERARYLPGIPTMQEFALQNI